MENLLVVALTLRGSERVKRTLMQSTVVLHNADQQMARPDVVSRSDNGRWIGRTFLATHIPPDRIRCGRIAVPDAPSRAKCSQVRSALCELSVRVMMAVQHSAPLREIASAANSPPTVQ